MTGFEDDFPDDGADDFYDPDEEWAVEVLEVIDAMEEDFGRPLTEEERVRVVRIAAGEDVSEEDWAAEAEAIEAEAEAEDAERVDAIVERVVEGVGSLQAQLGRELTDSEVLGVAGQFRNDAEPSAIAVEHVEEAFGRHWSEQGSRPPDLSTTEGKLELARELWADRLAERSDEELERFQEEHGGEPPEEKAVEPDLSTTQGRLDYVHARMDGAAPIGSEAAE